MMDENELDQQFQALESDTQVQAAETGTPPPPPVRRRITSAQVKKELDELKADIDKDVLDWLGQLDIKLEGLEATTATHNKTLLGDVKTRLDILDKGIVTLQGNQSELMKAYQALQRDVDGIPATPEPTDLNLRMVSIEEATATLADAVRSLAKDAAATPQPAAAELEFAQPPEVTVGELATKGDIAAMASVCLTMTDVLMICRLLKLKQSLSDGDRTYLLSIASRAAGVPLSPGLQIRAGVQNVEA